MITANIYGRVIIKKINMPIIKYDLLFMRFWKKYTLEKRNR